ncbi:MAG: enoyl-CoA hydratase/isomerase family protein [Deltaproteobacteria bacterium]|nr:enoyl-CoA hydratase/isomerase family protein [Deltaproteobacteria bacterium]
MEFVKTLFEKEVLTISLNRVEKKNALNTRTLNEFETVLDDIPMDRPPRAVVLRGEGRCFCAGADISELHAFDESGMREFHDLRERVYTKLEGLPCPTMAAVEGFALGTGLELALSVDFRIASESSFLGIPSSRLGVTESYLYLARLVRTVGLSRTRFLVFTAERLGAREARDLGLVERVFPEAEFEAGCRSLVDILASNDPSAMFLSKRVLAECDRDPFLENVHDPAWPMLESLGGHAMKDRTRAFLNRKAAKSDGGGGD